jgi:hypothetical protein
MYEDVTVRNIFGKSHYDITSNNYQMKWGSMLSFFITPIIILNFACYLRSYMKLISSIFVIVKLLLQITCALSS